VKNYLRFIPFLFLSLLLASCADSRMHAQAIYMLVDTSGTYSQELDKAQRIVSYLLGSLKSGDSLAVARVKSRSFSEKDIIAKATFTKDPMQVNNQKRSFADKIGTFKADAKKNAKVDIEDDVLSSLDLGSGGPGGAPGMNPMQMQQMQQMMQQRQGAPGGMQMSPPPPGAPGAVPPPPPPPPPPAGR